MKEVSQGGYAQFYTERPKGEYSSFNTPAMSYDGKWVFAGGRGGSASTLQYSRPPGAAGGLASLASELASWGSVLS